MDYLVETFKTGLTYDPNQPFGNANAGKNLWVSLSADNTAQLAADNASLEGRLLEVRQNGTCSVEVFALRTKAVAAAAIPRGSSLIGAGGGKVKASVAASLRPRGITRSAAANDNDVIDVGLIC